MVLIFVKPPFAPNFISQLAHFFFQFKRRQHLHVRGRQDEGRHRGLLPPPAGPARVGARLGEGAEGRRRAERDQLRLRRQPEGAAVGEEGRLSSAFFYATCISSFAVFAEQVQPRGFRLPAARVLLPGPFARRRDGGLKKSRLTL